MFGKKSIGYRAYTSDLRIPGKLTLCDSTANSILTIVVSGVSEDALLCMKKGGSFWGVYNAELPDYLNTLHQSLTESGRKLDYRAFFAESDVMIGKGGQEYFEQCWKSSSMDLRSTLVPKTNHETIVLPEKGCVVQVLEEIAAVSREMI